MTKSACKDSWMKVYITYVAILRSLSHSAKLRPRSDLVLVPGVTKSH